MINGLLERAGVEAREVDEVILGQVLPAGQGQNPVRQAAMKAGIPQEATAWGVNQLCGSGCSGSSRGMPGSSSPAARNPCPWLRTVRTLRNGTKMPRWAT